MPDVELLIVKVVDTLRMQLARQTLGPEGVASGAIAYSAGGGITIPA